MDAWALNLMDGENAGWGENLNAEFDLADGWDAPAVPVPDYPQLTIDGVDELVALVGQEQAQALVDRFNHINTRDAASAEIEAILRDENPDDDTDDTDETDMDSSDETDDETEEYETDSIDNVGNEAEHAFLTPDNNGIPHHVYSAPGEPEDTVWVIDDLVIRKRGNTWTSEIVEW